MNTREVLLNAVTQDNPANFLDLIEKHNSKNESFDVSEVLQTLSKKQHEKLWEGLKKISNACILNAAPNMIENEEEDEQAEKFFEMLACLQGVSTVALCAITIEKPVVPASLLETAVILHGIMMCLPEESQKLQASIAQVCETWFISDLEGKEDLITNTLPFFVIRSLAKATPMDVKHVWGLRHAMMLMDFEDDSSSSLKQLLHQCMIHPVYLRLEEGRRFLSFLFGMHPDFTKELHKTIKNQIPVCSMPVLSNYGEIYFRAWRVASDRYLETLETDCIQDLMYAAVHAQRAGTQSMASRLRKVLSYLHQQKKQKGVDEALVRLYQPILWRAFKVANPLVRANAAAILIDAFPLQNPDASNEDIDVLLQKQFDLLQDLLEDPSPIVRATGAHGVCRIAGVFWELIPVHTLKSLLTKLICQAAYDSTSSTVRLAVFQGLKFLLDNHLSHPLVKPLLGNLRDLIHDVSEKVRAAFVDLLLLVKGMKAIKFWTIVPIDHLLARLEVESSAPVMRKLVKLLMNSFHPLNKEPDVQVARCTALWDVNPMAARRFYQYAHLHVPVPTTGKFLLLLCRCLVQWAQSSTDETTLNEEDVTENKENETAIDEATEAVLTLPNEDTIAGILETVAISWAGIKDHLDKKANEGIKTKLVQQFTKALPRLLASIEDARGRAAIIFIAGNLPSSSLPNFSKRCLKTLSTMREGVNSQDFGPMLDCLCSWGKTADVLDIIKGSLAAKFDGTSTASTEKESSADHNACQLEAIVALDYLAWLLYEPACRSSMLEHLQKIKDVRAVLHNVTSLIESTLQSQSDVDEFRTKALKMLCHLNIHLHNTEMENEGDQSSEEMSDLVIWGTRIVIPALDIYSSSTTSTCTNEGNKRPNEDDDDECNKSNQTRDYLQVLLSCSSEMLKIGIADDMLCTQLAALIKSLTQLGSKSLPFLPKLTELMYQMSQRGSYLEAGNESQDYTQGILADVLRAISTNSNNENLTQVLMSLRPAFSEVIKSYECKRRAVKAGFVERPQIMATVMAASVAELSLKARSDQSDLTTLPPLSFFLLTSVLKSKLLLRSFVEELEHCVISGALQDVGSLGAVLTLLSNITDGNHKVDNIKSCTLQVQQQLEELSKNDALLENPAIKGKLTAAKELARSTLDRLDVVC